MFWALAVTRLGLRAPSSVRRTSKTSFDNPTLFRHDLLNDRQELVGERSSRQVPFGDLTIYVALCLLVLQDVAEPSVQPIVAVSLGESTPSETKPKVVRLDDLGRLLCPDQVKQRGVETLSRKFHELAPELSG